MTLPSPISAVTWQVGRMARSAGLSIAAYSAIALTGLTGTGFLVAGGFIWVASLTDPLIACLIVGGLLLVAAAIAAAILLVRAKERAKQERQSAANAAVMASSLSLASTGLRIMSRAKGPMFWPAAATVLATWYLTRNKN